MYFAAVAPPKPPPTTTTRAFEGVALVAQPVGETAPASLRKSRRFMPHLFCAAYQPAMASICASL